MFAWIVASCCQQQNFSSDQIKQLGFNLILVDDNIYFRFRYLQSPFFLFFSFKLKI